MKVFITKYALTKGIEEIEVSHSERYPHMVTDEAPGLFRSFFKGEWFHTREEAVADAEKRRLRKIESLKKQISNLESIKFS